MSDPAIPQIGITARAVTRLREGHVWVYASDVTSDGGAQPGDLVHVFGPRKQVLGSALYSSSSQIKIRMLVREQLKSEEELLRLVRDRLALAVAYRKIVVKDSDACRLVFSEADLLPGLIADQYNDIVTFQVLTQAWDRPERRQAIVSGLQELTGVGHIAERTDGRIRDLEQLPPLAAGMLHGGKSATVVTMNGVRFHYDALSGQKTGAFLDQRENYAAAAAYAHGTALDVCTYQGGFALHLARTCERVMALDISREALEIAEQNEKLNAAANKNEIEWIEANAFDLLKDYATAGRRYDAIVLDPPAFARTKRNLPAAVRGYKELNLRALQMLRPGGILVTCSCSFHVGEADLLQLLTAAAQDAHRAVRVLEMRAQAKDHPILLGVPETHYLKCVICSIG
ncbi:MAG TPA: class I SAM-dependent rRNA methyltransferase [Verrucomicrobiae bacterium]|jgi:23S rRNA (cytosine1962-C5)-methyltransferase|nr:class I SAM-dependent rRNA methyltransferase [Verrucomicrobiae bacterium]